MFKGFSHSLMGASHITSGTVCQDSSAFQANEKYAAAIVADGHGSKKHFRSDVGSKCAVEAALETISRFFAADDFMEFFPQNHEKILANMEKQVIALWNSKIFRHLDCNPVTYAEERVFKPWEFGEISPESYYGTTLIAAVTAKDFSFGFQIGDGSLVVVYADGKTEIPLGYEENAPANITASMCNANAADYFTHFFVNDRKVAAMFTSSDGLFTSFGSEDAFCHYHTIVASQLPNIEKFEPSIVKNIEKRTHYGTEDDISLACAYQPEVIAECSAVLSAKAANK